MTEPLPKTGLTHQIADHLLQEIEDGKYLPGEPIPSVASLQAQFDDCSTSPVRFALAELAHMGVIDTSPGQTARVRKPRPPVKRDGSRAGWEKNRALERDPAVRGSTGATEHATGLPKEDLVFDFSYEHVALPPDLAGEFGVPAGEPALKRNYHTMVRATGETLGMSTSYLLMVDVAGHAPLLDVENEPWPGATMHQLREVGVEVMRVADEITVRWPTVVERETLGMRRGEQVASITKRMYDTGERLVEIAFVALPGDSAKMTYEMKLDPWPVSHNDDVDAVIRQARRGR